MSELIDRMGHLECMYRRLMKEVKELSDVAQNSINHMSSRFLVGRFDELLQYILMCTASACGEYKELDHKLIRGLTLHSDIIETYNDIEREVGGKLEMSWDGLFKVMNIGGANGIASGLASLAEIIYPRTEFMIKALAPVSCMHHKNYLFEITSRFRWTITAFINATTPDGDRESREAKAVMAKNMIDAIFIQPWMCECETYCNMFLKNPEPYERAKAERALLDNLDILDEGDTENEEF